MSYKNSGAWSIDVATLFPAWFEWMQEVRPIKNAVKANELTLSAFDMREFSTLKHKQVDDTPYGGGAGMVLRVDVVTAALEGHYQKALNDLRDERRIIVLTPAGRVFDDALAVEWAEEKKPTTILCGRYEGFDHRVHEYVATDELSIGQFVLSGGEAAAMTVVDALARKLPGALGNEESLMDESFSSELNGGLEYPHYTRPADFRGWEIPTILTSGNHAAIDKWRKERSFERTELRKEEDNARG